MQKITISSRTKAWRLLNCSHTASYGLQQVSSLHHVFLEGEQALLIDSRRRNLIKLDSTKYTDTAVGRLSHADIIGKEVGAQHRTVLGGRVTVRRPSLEEYTLLMHRGATPSYCSVVYAAVCMMDVGGGSRVVEAGSGSGAMTLHLSRIGAHVRMHTHHDVLSLLHVRILHTCTPYTKTKLCIHSYMHMNSNLGQCPAISKLGVLQTVCCN